MNYQLLITRQLNEDIAKSEEMAKAVYNAIERFNNCDWGNLPEEDKTANNTDLLNREGHVLAKYETPNGDIYINLVFDDPEGEKDSALLMYCNEY